MFMLCEGHFNFFKLACTSAAIFTKFPMFVLTSFVPFFLSKQDCYGAKEAFVSSHFENLLKDIVFLNSIQLKTQNMPFKSLMDD